MYVCMHVCMYVCMYVCVYVCVCKYMHLLLQMLCVDLSHMTLLQGLLLFDPFARIILLQGLGWDTVPFSRGILLQGLGWDIPFSRGILLQGLGPVTYPFSRVILGGGDTLPFFKGYPFARIGARHLPFFKGCHVRAIPFFKGFAEHPFARAGSSLKDCNPWWTASLHLQRMQTWSFLASMHGSLWVSGCHRFWHPMSPALARCPLNHQRPPGSPTLWHTLPCPPPQCDWCSIPTSEVGQWDLGACPRFPFQLWGPAWPHRRRAHAPPLLCQGASAGPWGPGPAQCPGDHFSGNGANQPTQPKVLIGLQEAASFLTLFQGLQSPSLLQGILPACWWQSLTPELPPFWQHFLFQGIALFQGLLPPLFQDVFFPLFQGVQHCCCLHLSLSLSQGVCQFPAWDQASPFWGS